MKLILRYAYSVYLALILALIGYPLTTWQFWAISVPVIALVEAKVVFYRKE